MDPFNAPVMYDPQLAECLTVIQALHTPSEEYQITYSLTATQLHLILAIAEESRLFDIRAKFWFDEQAEQITLMSPTRSIHDTLVGDFLTMTQFYTVCLPIPRKRVLLRVSRHARLLHGPQALDFQLRLTNFKRLWRLDMWMGECGYRSNRGMMIKKLGSLARYRPSVQLAFIIDVDESTYSPPPEDSDVARRLRAQPMLDMAAFLPDVDANADVSVHVQDLQRPIVAHGWTWGGLKEIKYTLCVRSACGMFDFDGSDPERTVHGTLFPLIDMANVNRLLEVARVQLNDTIVNHLSSQKMVDTSMVDTMRRYSTPFECGWEETRASALASWRNTAYERYVSWYRRETQIRL